jgi:ATP/maltotriose-dependent transcriptional regulator MalT
VPLDRRDRSYRYHRLFIEALRAELRRREAGREAELHRRASAWCAAHGDTDKAIKHAIDGRDIERAAWLLWNSALQHIARGRHRIVSDSLDRFTDEQLANNPFLALAAASTALMGGDLYEAERWTSRARTVVDDTADAQGGVALMKAGVGRRGIAEIDSNAAHADELLAESSPWRSLCALFSGVALHLMGITGEARERLEEGAHRAAASAPMVQALCLAQLALLTADEDDLERAATLAERGVAQVRRAGLEESPMVALPFAVSAELRSRRGQVEEATSDLRQSVELLSCITDPSHWYEAECRIVLARATLRLGGPAAAVELPR